jgi:hypothetical protein
MAYFEAAYSKRQVPALKFTNYTMNQGTHERDEGVPPATHAIIKAFDLQS